MARKDFDADVKVSHWALPRLAWLRDSGTGLGSGSVYLIEPCWLMTGVQGRVGVDAIDDCGEHQGRRGIGQSSHRRGRRRERQE